MKIAFPIILAKSGSDVYFERLSAGLKKRGIRGEILALGYQYEFVPFLSRLVAKKLTSFDIIHANADYGTLFRRDGTPFFVTLFHSVFDLHYQRFTTRLQKIYHYGLLKRRLRRSLAACRRAICISKATRQSFGALFPEWGQKLSVIPCGIDTDFFRPLKEHTPVRKGALLFVGNLSRRKGADLLGPIMERLGKGFELFCIGRVARGFKLPTNVKYLGPVGLQELLAWYNKCEMLLFPSRLEGFGYAVAEAMACGKPVVCTNRSSLPELLDHGLGGYLCEPEDVSGFAESVRRISQTPGLAEKMGQYNRQKAEKALGLDRMVDAYVQVYQESLGNDGGTGPRK